MELIGCLSQFPPDMKVAYDVSNNYDDHLWLVDVESLDVVENIDGEFVLMLSDAIFDEDEDIKGDDETYLLN